MNYRTALGFLLSIALLAVGAPRGHAQILLKPKGENAAPLRAKSLKADVKIRGAFAQTQLNYVFQNETSERVEADFIYTVPPHAVVTYFAYWYGEEKVVARVVEKERAAAIYKYITSRMRDPALVEMIGKNTFRARIFPIEPNADLKVEVRLAQSLESDGNGAFYDLALKGQEKGKGTFDDLKVNVAVQSDATLNKVVNNYSLPVSNDKNGYALTLAQRNFLPSRDLRVRLMRAPRTLQATLYAARASGSDGFFALALSPQSQFSRPQVMVSGIRTYETAPEKLPFVPARGTLVVTGRYRGSGPATITLKEGAKSYSAAVVFEDKAETDNLAAKLWASRRIEQLSARESNRARVIAMSKQFTLPSKFTSWLAVPKAEIARFKQETALAELSVLGRRVAMQIANSKAQSAATRQLRAQFDEQARRARVNGEEQLAAFLNDAAREVSQQLSEEKFALRPDRTRLALLKLQVERLQKAGAEGGDGRTPIYILEEDMRLAGRAIVDEIARGRGEGRRAQLLRRQLKEMEKRSMKLGYGFDSNWSISDALAIKERMLAGELLDAKQKKHPNAKRLAAMKRQLRYLSGARAEQVIEQEKSAREARIKEERFQRAYQQLSSLAEELGQEILAGREQGDKAKQLQQRFDALSRQHQKDDTYGSLHSLSSRPRVAYRARAHVLAHQILTEEKLPSPDSRKIADLRLQLAKAGKAAGYEGNPSQPFLDWEADIVARGEKPVDPHAYFMRQGDPLISIEAPADAVQVIALMPDGEIKKLVLENGHWQARFDVPTHADEGSYVITIIIVNRDGTRRTLTLRYKVDVTAPRGTATAHLANPADQAATPGSAEKLRLEIAGDADCARAMAILPWGTKIQLAPSSQRTHGFFALADVPGEWRGKALKITYVLTDRAHNRTTLCVDATQ